LICVSAATNCYTLPYTTLFRSISLGGNCVSKTCPVRTQCHQAGIGPAVVLQGCFAVRSWQHGYRVTGLSVEGFQLCLLGPLPHKDRKSTRLHSSHVSISYAVFC